MRVETRSSVESGRNGLHQQYFPWPQRPNPRFLDSGLYEGGWKRAAGVGGRSATLPGTLAVFKVYRIEERAFQARVQMQHCPGGCRFITWLPSAGKSPYSWRSRFWACSALRKVAASCRLATV